MSPLSTLPDLCLLAIFDRVSVHDLCHTVPLVCKRWTSLHVTACHRRKTLILVKSEVHLSSALDIRHIELMNYAIRQDGTPYQDITIPPHYHNSCLVCPLECSSTNLIPYLRFAELFPYVRTLKIIQYPLPAYDLCTVQVLLHHWASSITNLKLAIQIDEPKNDDEIDDNVQFNRTVQDGIHSIMHLINNRMPQLKHLSLNVETPNAYKQGAIRPDLKAISTLETLCYRSFRFVDGYDFHEPLGDIELYGSNATVLRDISVVNFSNLNRLLKLSPQLAKKFTQNGLIDCINPENINKFTRYCSQFSSLTDLSIRIEHSYTVYCKVIRALANLHKLIHLAVTINLEDQNIDHEEEEEQAEQELSQPRLPSVVALSLFVVTKSHYDFAFLDLPATFPNLQVMLLRHDSPRCTECGYGPFGLDQLNLLETISWPLIGQMQDCMKQARSKLYGLEKLRKLNVNKMPDRRMNINVGYKEYGLVLTRDELLVELQVL